MLTYNKDTIYKMLKTINKIRKFFGIKEEDIILHNINAAIFEGTLKKYDGVLVDIALYKENDVLHFKTDNNGNFLIPYRIKLNNEDNTYSFEWTNASFGSTSICFTNKLNFNEKVHSLNSPSKFLRCDIKRFMSNKHKNLHEAFRMLIEFNNEVK